MDGGGPSYFQMQVRATPHLIFPAPFRWIMRHVMEHTAHHADPGIPLYHLPDAQKSVEDLQTELQVEFERRLRPILSEVASTKNLHMVFSQADSGVVWANPGLDITADVIKKLDAVAGTAPKP